MDNEGKNNAFTVLLLLLIFGLIGYLVYDNFIKKDKVVDDEEYRPYSDINTEYKNYGVNEYVKLSVNDEQMARIYLTNYQNLIRENNNEAYSLVDDSYKKSKCQDINKFNDIVEKNKITSLSMYKYGVISKDGYKYYIVENAGGSAIVFKTSGVMQYTVYLDNETVVINK